MDQRTINLLKACPDTRFEGSPLQRDGFLKCLSSLTGSIAAKLVRERTTKFLKKTLE